MNKLSQLHDAEIVGIHLTEGNLDIEVADCANKFVRLEDLIALRVEDFILRNIISVAWVVDAGTTRAKVAEVLRSTVTQVDGTQLLDEDAFERVVDEVGSGLCIIVEFEPSWGASLYAACRRIRIDGVAIVI